MSKRTRLFLLGGALLLLVIGGFSYRQLVKARQEQALDRLVQNLETATKNGSAASANCNALIPAVQAKLVDLEARHSGQQLWRIYRGIADCSLPLGKPEQAITFYEKIVIATPQEGRAHGDLAMALSRAGRHPEAVRSAQLSTQLSPNAWQAHRVLGRVHNAAGQTAEAIAAFERALALAPPAEHDAAKRLIDNLKAKLAPPAPAETAPAAIDKGNAS